MQRYVTVNSGRPWRWALATDLDRWHSAKLHGMQWVNAWIDLAVPVSRRVLLPTTVQGAHGGRLVGAGRAYAFKMDVFPGRGEP
jgi:hypothetical protein